MAGPPQIFDRRLYARRRARALGTDFLVQDVAAHISDRIGAINGDYRDALDLSSRGEGFPEFRREADRWTRTALNESPEKIVVDEEALPFLPASFDLITSILSLHTVNDLPGALIQICRTLRPNGLFVAAMFGGETLRELREAFAFAESEISGGITPRVSPSADVRDLGALLQRAGFASPVADLERSIVRYRSFDKLAEDLRALGETNSLQQRSHSFLRRDVLSTMLSRYAELHADDDGRLRATFDIIYLTGLAPRDSQAKIRADASCIR